MKLNVNYREINRIGNSVESKAVELNRKINELVVLIDSLKDCWGGNDCTTFINKSTLFRPILGIDSKVNIMFSIFLSPCNISFPNYNYFMRKI